MYGALAEFSGVLTASPFDQFGNNSSGTSPATVTLGGTDAQAGQLIVSIQFWRNTKAVTDTTSDSYNNGATPTTNLNNDATSIANHYRFAWGTTTGNSSADTNTVTSGSMSLAEGAHFMVSFKIPTVSVTRVPRKTSYPQIIAH